MLPENPLKWALAEFASERQELYRKYSRYLAGDQPLEFATEKFRSAFGRTFEEFAYNRTGPVVEAFSDRLEVIGFEAAKEAPEGEQGLSDRAQAIWDRNMMAVHEDQVEVEALGSGDAYVIAELDHAGNVQLWPQSAQECRVFYSDEQPGLIEMGVKQWLDSSGHARINIYFKDRIEKYRSRSKAALTNDLNQDRDGDAVRLAAGTFERYKPESDRTWPIRLPVTDTVPVFHFANSARINSYGKSELTSVIPIQDSLNKTIMDLLVAMEFAAFPQRVLLNIDFDAPDLKEQIQRFQAGIDRILALRASYDGANPAIGEFSAADVKQYLGPIDLFDALISRSSKVPVHYLQMSGGFPSGRALRIAEAPFVAKLKAKQVALGAVWNAVIGYALRLEGMTVKPGDIKVVWQSAAPLSAEDELEMALMKQSLGLPLKRILVEWGYTTEEVEDILEEKAEQALEGARAFNAGASPIPLADRMKQRAREKAEAERDEDAAAAAG